MNQKVGSGGQDQWYSREILNTEGTQGAQRGGYNKDTFNSTKGLCVHIALIPSRRLEAT